MKALKLSLIGVAAYVAFAVLLIPADRLYGWFGDRQQVVKLYDISGTVWSGGARTALLGNQALRTVKWQVRPWSVVTGGLKIAWSFDNGDAWANGVASLNMNNTLGFKDTTAKLPISQLQPYLRLPVVLEGLISLDVDSLTYDPVTQWVTKAQGVVNWNEAGVAKVTDQPLGDFRLAVATESDQIKGQLQDGGGGPLAAAGLLEISPERKWSFDGELSLRDQSRRDLVNMLSLFGPADPQGRIKLKQSGVL